MEREIKFKVWITADKEDWSGCYNYDDFDWENRMRIVSSIHFPLDSFSGKDISTVAICENDNYSNGWLGANFKDDKIISRDYILMQFTGLKDKNGKDIYEGDIVRWDDGTNGERWRVAVVEINPDLQFRIIKIKCDFHQSAKEGYIFRYGKFIYKDTENHLEIIGNIHENPDLLK